MSVDATFAPAPVATMMNAPPTPPRQAPALELVDVGKRYGGVEVLQPTSIVLEDGEFVTLLGPSGSGKSTILGIAAGIVLPDAGRVLFRGTDVTTRPPHLRNVGMVFQRYTLFPNKTVAGNVGFPLHVRGVPRREAADRIAGFLDLVGLRNLADRYPAQLSGGQAQRVALARALVFEPALLLMDEPLGALDRRLKQGLQQEIRRIQQKTRVPTLYVTHDQEEAMNISDRIAVVRDGRVAATGTPRDLYRVPASAWLAEFLGDANIDRVALIGNAADGRCEVTTQAGIRTGARCPLPVSVQSGCALVIRPEDCAVTAARPPAGAAFAGTLVDVTYLGPQQRLEVRLDEGWTVIAMAQGRDAPGLAVGAQVFCSWSDDAPLLVPED